MAIDEGTRAEILRLHGAEKWRVGTIARQLGVHHSTVTRVVGAGAGRRKGDGRSSKIDPWLPFIRETLESWPGLTASRLHRMAWERGYRGSESHFRRVVAGLRPRAAPEAYLRLKTLPGEQAQVDWGHFGKIAVGRAERPLMAFVMVLSHSRRIFLRFFPGSVMSHFLRGHVAAFEAWQGVPRELWYDNLKSVVAERRGDAIRFNPQFLDFAGHYRFLPRPVAVARGNEKGRVERAIRYIRSNFFAARKWRSLDDLNAQALSWCDTAAVDRPWPDNRALTVAAAFRSERPHLLPLPDDTWPVDDRREVQVGKTPYVRFDLNDYSVPHTLVRRTLVAVATMDEVRVLDGAEVVARHPRSFDRGATVENEDHIASLRSAKRQARRLTGQDRLIRAAPSAGQLLVQAARRGDNLGACVSALLRLLKTCSASDLETAIAAALERGAPHHNAVRLELSRRREERERPPPVPLELGEEARRRDVVVSPHDLAAYDNLADNEEEQQ